MTQVSLVGSKLGNYRIERLLGRGRMGMVYLARDEALLRHVAVKVLAWSLSDVKNQDPEAWLLAEARNIARVSHPGVIQVHGVARHGTHAYIVMEFVDGVSAEQMQKERGRFEPGPATEILLQIASALQAAHDCGVIHRDVKPANILIRGDGTAKLGDFGMAVHRQGPSAVATGHPQVGTPLYTAPEIWGGAEATPATDLYALGATYHHLLTGHPPFEAEDLQSLVQAHLHQRPPRLAQLASRLPEGCLQLLERTLAKSPTDRVASAQALAWMARGALRSIERSKQDGRRPSGPSSSNRPPPAPRPNAKPSGFARAPFADFEQVPDLESFEPFRSVATVLRGSLAQPGAVLHLSGELGSGRAPLLRSLLASRLWRGPVAWLDVDSTSAVRPLDQRACHAFGAAPSPTSSTNGGIEGLLDHLAATTTEPGLLIIDAKASLRMHAHTLQALSVAARATGHFSLILIGGPDAGGFLDAPEEVVLPPFTSQQTLAYLRGRLALARERGAAPLLLTVDAALLVHVRSGGNLERANRIATRMLTASAAQRTRVLTSFHAWSAADSMEGLPAPSTDGRAWPTSEVFAVLNAQRAALGLGARQASLSNTEPKLPT